MHIFWVFLALAFSVSVYAADEVSLCGTLLSQNRPFTARIAEFILRAGNRGQPLEFYLGRRLEAELESQVIAMEADKKAGFGYLPEKELSILYGTVEDFLLATWNEVDVDPSRRKSKRAFLSALAGGYGTGHTDGVEILRWPAYWSKLLDFIVAHTSYIEFRARLRVLAIHQLAHSTFVTSVEPSVEDWEAISWALTQMGRESQLIIPAVWGQIVSGLNDSSLRRERVQEGIARALARIPIAMNEVRGTPRVLRLMEARDQLLALQSGRTKID